MHHASTLKAKYEVMYEKYKVSFKANPTEGETVKDAFRWGNEQAAFDITNETKEIQDEVDDYVEKYNAGTMKSAEEYRALIAKDTTTLEKRRFEKMKKVQKYVACSFHNKVINLP